MTAKLPDIGSSGPILAFATTAAPLITHTPSSRSTPIPALDEGIVLLHGGGSSLDTAFTAMAGDWVRLRRVGSKGYGDVSHDNGSTWTTTATKPISTAAMRLFVQTGTTNADGAIQLLQASANVV